MPYTSPKKHLNSDSKIKLNQKGLYEADLTKLTKARHGNKKVVNGVAIN